VSTRSEGPTWFIRDGEDALLCDIGDAGGMAAAIGHLRTETALGPRLAEAGRARLAAEFARGPVLDAYEELFDRKKRAQARA
ncbi:glycosyltransferase, partial [Roseicyclus sp.]|uniref:glycosyltransferase n=1 Tax=Roseicyclus sp. TaxID=1914329 RepID=UPI003FA02D5C